MNSTSGSPDTNLFYHLINCRNSINLMLAQEFNYYEAPYQSNANYHHSTTPNNMFHPYLFTNTNRNRNRNRNSYRNTANNISSLIDIMEQIHNLNSRYNLQNNRNSNYRTRTQNTTSSPQIPRFNINPRHTNQIPDDTTHNFNRTTDPITGNNNQTQDNRVDENNNIQNNIRNTNYSPFTYNFSSSGLSQNSNLNNIFDQSNLQSLFRTQINRNTDNSSTTDTADTSATANNIRDRLRQVLPELVEITLYSDGRVVNTDNLEDVPVPTNLHNLRENTEVGTFENLNTGSVDDSCSICRERFSNTDIVRRINSCQHLFHMNCLDTWLETHTTCPMCRVDIRENNTPTQETDDNMPELID